MFIDKTKIQASKNHSLFEYLHSLGIEPVKMQNGQYWYHSPFRTEDKTPSFCLHPDCNVFNCFATGLRGDVISFIQSYHKLSFMEAVQHLDNRTPTIAPLPSFLSGNNIESPTAQNNSIKIKAVKPLANSSLLSYLSERKIDLSIAKTYLNEAYYQINVKNYFALSFENDLGGLELRNKYFKGSTSPKGIKTIVGQRNDTCMVFEGVFDFLSYLTLTKSDIPLHDSIVLNSTVNKHQTDLYKYNRVLLLLDNDLNGKETAVHFQTRYENVRDESSRYANHKDLNEFLIVGTKPP